VIVHLDEGSDQRSSLPHSGYFTSPTQTKEDAQVALIQLLLSRSGLSEVSATTPLRVLDVGCGLGGTTRYLAQECGFEVTGVTISSEQVKMAYNLSRTAAGLSSGTLPTSLDGNEPEIIKLGAGSVRFIQMDAETMGERFDSERFDVVWICEALSHFPDKALFFRNAAKVLVPGGRLVMADWFRSTEVAVDSQVFNDEIKPIEDGMLLPPLDTMRGYTDLAKAAGLEVRPELLADEEGSSQGQGWKDISQEVAKTWWVEACLSVLASALLTMIWSHRDISLGLVASPSLWAFAFTQGRDFVAFLKAFQAMRKGFASGSFRYGVAAFLKSQ
jgi:tocopherol O-methyltransferase